MRLSGRRLLNSARRLNIPDLFINSLFYSKLSAKREFFLHPPRNRWGRATPSFLPGPPLSLIRLLPPSLWLPHVSSFCPAAGALSNSSSPFNPVSLKWSCLSLLTTEAHDRFAFEPSVVGEWAVLGGVWKESREEVTVQVLSWVSRPLIGRSPTLSFSFFWGWCAAAVAQSNLRSLVLLWHSVDLSNERDLVTHTHSLQEGFLLLAKRLRASQGI